MQEEQLWRFAADLAPLASSLDGRDTRAALAAAFAALAKLLPDLQLSSTLLTDLNAMSTTEVCIAHIFDRSILIRVFLSAVSSVFVHVINHETDRQSACNIMALKSQFNALTLWLCLLSGGCYGL